MAIVVERQISPDALVFPCTNMADSDYYWYILGATRKVLNFKIGLSGTDSLSQTLA